MIYSAIKLITNDSKDIYNGKKYFNLAYVK